MTTTPQVTNFCPRCEEYARQIQELTERAEVAEAMTRLAACNMATSLHNPHIAAAWAEKVVLPEDCLRLWEYIVVQERQAENDAK